MINETPDYKKAILSLVHDGITYTDLVMEVMTWVNPLIFNQKDYLEALTSLIIEKSLIRLEYIIPKSNYNPKTMYFPRDTRFEISE